MGRPPIGNGPMTPAERQRRHRAKLEQEYRDKVAVTKPTSGNRDSSTVTKPSPYLSQAELEAWADRLDISRGDMDELQTLIGRRETQVTLGFLTDDPAEAARWLVRELGWPGVFDLVDAISELEEKEDA